MEVEAVEVSAPVDPKGEEEKENSAASSAVPAADDQAKEVPTVPLQGNEAKTMEVVAAYGHVRVLKPVSLGVET